MRRFAVVSGFPLSFGTTQNTRRLNVARAGWSAPSVTTQGFVPEQAPLQPVNVEPAAGVAVSVTTVPSASAAEQVAPQAIAAGELVTVPLPAPAGLTVNVCMISVNVAVAVWS